MIEPTLINIIRILAAGAMMFFWGMSTDVSDEMREKARILWFIFMGIIWIIASVTGHWN